MGKTCLRVSIDSVSLPTGSREEPHTPLLLQVMASTGLSLSVSVPCRSMRSLIHASLVVDGCSGAHFLHTPCLSSLQRSS